MTTLRRILGISLVLVSAITLSGCQHHYKGYYRNYWRIPSHPHSSGNIQNTSNVSQPSYRPAADPFYAQQNAAREANLRAVQQQQYKNDMQNYQKGYSNKLPNY
jgi:hypothetical protein